MNLGQLIELLKAMPDKAKVLPKGFKNPHSWRGIYAELAFEPADNVSVADMLAAAESAVGSTYEGWKGGDNTMQRDTTIHISKPGESFDYIGDYLLFYLSGEPVKEDCNDCFGRFKPPLVENHTRVQCLEKQLADAKERESWAKR